MNTYKNKLSVMIRDVVSAKNLASVSMLCATTAGMIGYTGEVKAADGESMAYLEEVVVTARRREESIQDVPVAVTAMSEDFLRTQNIAKIEDLGTKVPSLRISSAGASQNEPLISLRGQRPAESAFNQDQAVPMYFNDIVMAPTQGTNLGMYDLQSVQVLKGPQGTLFGRNSTGGAILLAPKRPGDQLGGYVDVQMGNYDLVALEGAVDLPVTENLQVRLSARKVDRDGFQENIADNALHGDDYSDEHSKSARISVNYDRDSFNNYLVLAQDENRVSAAVLYNTSVNGSVGIGWAAGQGYLPDYAAGVQRNIERDDPWKVETDVDSEEYVRNTFASNTTEFEINDSLTIKNIFGYRKVIFETATDVDGTAFPGWGTPTLGAPGVTTNPDPSEFKSEFFSDEIQLLGNAFDERLEWIAGLYWSKTDGTQDYKVQQAPNTYDMGVSTAINKSKGAFGEATWHFSEAWSVTAGVRKSWDEREMTLSKWDDLARTNCTMAGTTMSVCERTVSEDFDANTWRASVNFKPTDDILLYGSVSKGYRAGGFNTRGVNDASLEPFDPELVTTYEIGNKADWDIGGMALRSNIAVYWQDYEDIHLTAAFDENGTVGTRTENAGKAVIKGAEFDFTLLPTDNLQLTLSYSYVDAEYKDKQDMIGGVLKDTSSSSVFTYIPEQSLTFSTTYTLPVDSSLGEMSLMASVYWQDKMYTSTLINEFANMEGRFTPSWTDEDVAAATDFSTQDSYEVWNLRFDWRSVMGSNFDVAAFVNNAGDEQYVLGGLNVINSGGYGGYMYGAPRTYGGSLRYTF